MPKELKPMMLYRMIFPIPDVDGCDEENDDGPIGSVHATVDGVEFHDMNGSILYRASWGQWWAQMVMMDHPAGKVALYCPHCHSADVWCSLKVTGGNGRGEADWYKAGCHSCDRRFSVEVTASLIEEEGSR